MKKILIRIDEGDLRAKYIGDMSHAKSTDDFAECLRKFYDDVIEVECGNYHEDGTEWLYGDQLEDIAKDLHDNGFHLFDLDDLAFQIINA